MSVSYKLHRNGDIVQYVPGQAFIDERNASRLGNMEKTFAARGLYRKLSGAACELWDNRINKPIFVTLTTSKPVDHGTLNKCLSNYLDNLKKNYNLNTYLWVAERTKVGATHYHTIFDIPFVPVTDLNRAWCKSYSDYAPYSNNAVRLPNTSEYKAIIKSRSRVVRYICKYISKTDLSAAKNYSCSRSLVKEPLYLDEFTARDLLERYAIGAKIFDYATVYFTRNSQNIYSQVEKSYLNDFTGTLAIQPAMSI